MPACNFLARLERAAKGDVTKEDRNPDVNRQVPELPRRGVYIDVVGVEKVVACLVASHTLWQVVRLEKLDNLSIATLHKARPVVHHDEFVGIDVTVVKMKALELVDLKNRDSELEEAELVEELEVGGDLVDGDQVPAEQNEGDKRGRHHRLSV
eukprot:CAMPEP_0182527182 /NCGR_PEP_ID=MMETSP1323-20130603/3688_1 /TAXON_ID=236787 /ORGANISM="Florenciella parvula, Strain RCC1693" /LENGTH=152 /DNA_ID=CAMNT_0024736147 /DNA_START=202 /DNA_END=656 /DNA_ORIENTATION=+